MENGNSLGLSRGLGLLSLTATGVCSMVGASIYIVPFMVQRHIPGIGPYVLLAFAAAAVPAVLAAIAYAILSTAMPRAGGSYVYVSRSLHPYFGFIASFAQWFGLSIAIGVVSYVIVPFLRDIALGLGFDGIGVALEKGIIRVGLALLLLWTFVWVNIRGIRAYEVTLIPLMILMFLLGAIVIVTGYINNHQDFASSYRLATGGEVPSVANPTLPVSTFLSATALLFSSFIGFDSIAQAGGEARNPARNLPLAILLTIGTVGGFYFLFTSAVYHAVPWSFVATQAARHDITATGLLQYLIPSGLAVAMTAGAALALTNDLPAMILSVSRLMYAWADDRIFPEILSSVHSKYRTPHLAILASGFMASIGILGCHFAGTFFLGIDIMVTSMLINFILVCLALLALPATNIVLARSITAIKNRRAQIVISVAGVVLLTGLLCIHVWKDLTGDVPYWYYRSTPAWIIVMLVGSLLYAREWFKLKKSGKDVTAFFKELPPE